MFEVIMIFATVLGILALVAALGAPSEAWMCFWLAIAVVSVGVMFGAWSVIDRG